MTTPRSGNAGDSPTEIREIRFVQSGGFAGLLRGCDVTAADLGAEDRRALERHLHDSGEEASPRAGVASAKGAGRDLVNYEIELETEAGRVRLEFDDSNVPEDLAPLIERLSKRAKPLPP
jgi:hypothetical protein